MRPRPPRARARERDARRRSGAAASAAAFRSSVGENSRESSPPDAVPPPPPPPTNATPALRDPRAEFLDAIRDIQERCADIPDEVIVSVVGDMITEEALPTYQSMLNTLDGTKDNTGADTGAWARWTRAWTVCAREGPMRARSRARGGGGIPRLCAGGRVGAHGVRALTMRATVPACPRPHSCGARAPRSLARAQAEENRHGDLMNKYLWMTGRVDMVAVERTIQYLIGSGMDPKTDNNPYLGYLYTSFQERATKISHSNTRLLARAAGDDMLGKICGLVAADEARHEAAYQMVVEKLFSVDPEGTMAAYEDMMRKQIVMPAHLMYDGENENLWTEFSAVAEKQGVYTAMDYADIVEHLNKKWKIADMAVLGDAGASQEYLLKLPARIRRLAERAEKRAKSLNKEPVDARISWVYNRPVKM